MSVKKYVKFLNLIPSRDFLTYRFPSPSIFGQISRKTWTLLGFLKDTLVSSKRRRGALIGTLKLKDTYDFSKCISLIVANGPSTQNINWDAVSRYQESGRLKLAVVNYFNQIVPSYIAPDFLVLSDPNTRPDNTIDTRNYKLWQRVMTNEVAHIVTPTHWHKTYPDGLRCDSQFCLHFDDRSLEGITNNINPRFPRGYSTLTSFKALAYMKYLGFSKIYICGFDNSQYKEVFVNHENQVIQRSSHAVENYTPDVNLTLSHGVRVEDYFFEIAYLNNNLRNCFSSFEIINLGKSSAFDVFPRPNFIVDEFARNLLCNV